jgi:hypothetical protein
VKTGPTFCSRVGCSICAHQSFQSGLPGARRRTFSSPDPTAEERHSASLLQATVLTQPRPKAVLWIGVDSRPSGQMRNRRVAPDAGTHAAPEANVVVAVCGQRDVASPHFSHSRGCWLGPCRAACFPWRLSRLANTPGIGGGAKTCRHDNALRLHPATV